MGIVESSSTNPRMPLLDHTVNGAVDHKGLLVFCSSSGGWRSASLIIGVEVAERFAYFGIALNLITFLTGPLHQSVATAAKNVNIWFLYKALLPSDGGKEYGKVCSNGEVEEAKQVLRLVPIWATSLVYGVVISQSFTFFTKQGVTMNRTISPSFDVPAAMLNSFTSVAIVMFLPIYDRIIVPLARVITRKPAGITMLQRIGTGMVLSTLSIVIAALVETKRLKTAEEHGLIDLPNVALPMSIWWMVPQYFVSGVADAFTMVGLQEFFYSQVPNELRSVGLSPYLSIIGVGSLLSGFLLSAIENITSGDSRYSWFTDNLNRAHLDYFYWLLAGLSAIGIAVYVYFAKSYVYRRESRS